MKKLIDSPFEKKREKPESSFRHPNKGRNLKKDSTRAKTINGDGLINTNSKASGKYNPYPIFFQTAVLVHARRLLIWILADSSGISRLYAKSQWCRP